MNIVIQEQLTAAEKLQVQTFIKETEAATNCRFKIDYQVFDEVPAFLYYHFIVYQAEKIVGYLLLSQYCPEEIEGTLVLSTTTDCLPVLITKVKEELIKRETNKILFVVDRQQSEVCDFLKEAGYQYQFSELAMAVTQQHLTTTKQAEILMEKATLADQPAIQKLWGTDDAELEIPQADLLKTWLYRKNQQIIATLRLEESPENIGIYGFVVHPDFRGQGIGRQVLQTVCCQQLNKTTKPIYLEVEKDNLPAKNLYVSLGFQTLNQYDYFA
ncbi:ribosomal protein S18 acetylase RimI-like enzyme [Enterococcus sp. PF1-24]|uniref:GNAT family N-acetyltransferase n=1 Tax=unclassified Enterococcus TaxID=2608891 RepID=UPI0024743C4C|nr:MULTISPECIES: GNAT family N-acetyltransferase [unclassified Enterococcus]MDH6365754.1 ribosomal protein S18 acetylase RimI-like enzyme [Enterococcus sp. PFB1-1]MDH6402863.1 ribosomal protein S18 acetylase RimI-like enzyme [Enterococcus sp. PF1-24]